MKSKEAWKCKCRYKIGHDEKCPLFPNRRPGENLISSGQVTKEEFEWFWANTKSKLCKLSETFEAPIRDQDRLLWKVYCYKCVFWRLARPLVVKADCAGLLKTFPVDITAIISNHLKAKHIACMLRFVCRLIGARCSLSLNIPRALIPHSYLRSIGSKLGLDSIRGFPDMEDYMSLFAPRGISPRLTDRDVSVVT